MVDCLSALILSRFSRISKFFQGIIILHFAWFQTSFPCYFPRWSGFSRFCRSSRFIQVLPKKFVSGKSQGKKHGKSSWFQFLLGIFTRTWKNTDYHCLGSQSIQGYFMFNFYPSLFLFYLYFNFILNIFVSYFSLCLPISSLIYVYFMSLSNLFYRYFNCILLLFFKFFPILFLFYVYFLL